MGTLFLVSALSGPADAMQRSQGDRCGNLASGLTNLNYWCLTSPLDHAILMLKQPSLKERDNWGFIHPVLQ